MKPSEFPGLRSAQKEVLQKIEAAETRVTGDALLEFAEREIRCLEVVLTEPFCQALQLLLKRHFWLIEVGDRYAWPVWKVDDGYEGGGYIEFEIVQGRQRDRRGRFTQLGQIAFAFINN